MEKFTIYYSVQNGGDGSAYPQFMESIELAEWDQDHMDEGWGESCVGWVELESESPIKANFEITTHESFYLEKEDDDAWRTEYKKDFMKEFFPNGLPEFVVKISSAKPRYYSIFRKNDGKHIHEKFCYPGDPTKEKALELEKQLNENKNI